MKVLFIVLGVLLFTVIFTCYCILVAFGKAVEAGGNSSQMLSDILEMFKKPTKSNDKKEE
jgi:uncharacterized protein (UPF0333 family)